ncbi:response regulator [Umezawaea endophytica]|uniref:Response regulator transcription factor n=1 Tax=Umezawaea endophytica TaxID=1654476 RepID=A0A9X2VHB8_9PSEU|nr:response regulator transcription factor [Umezawaea endophytica]MCS7476720.1 response regulator transcription factor [Umezawaea endophytica]
MLTVLLADDHALFRSGVRAVLDAQPDLTCVGEVADGRAAVDEVARLRPDVVVLDVRMPETDGLTAAEAIMTTPGNTTAVLVLTTYDSDESLHRALRAGVNGFILKSIPPEEMMSAIRVAARGDTAIDPSVARRLSALIATTVRAPEPPRELDKLTSREHEVLLLLAAARTNAEIAAHLQLGEETVRTHVSRVLGKLRLRDRAHAAVFAHTRGIVRAAERRGR